MDGQTSADGSEKQRNLLIILFVGFVLSGIATVIVGPMLPIFKQRWVLADSQLGLFSTVQFLAALAGTLGSSAIAHKWGYRPAIVMGYALIGAGLAGLNADSHLLAMVATGTFGLGYGLLTPGTNLFVAEVGGLKSASMLNLLNFMWSVGAMACSPMISLALKQNKLPVLLSGFAAFGLVMMLILLLGGFSMERHEEIGTESPPRPASGHVGLAVTVVMAALFFIYVAMENSIGNWAAEFAKRLMNGITSTTTLAPMFFYAGLTLGRALASLFLKRWSERNVVLTALIVTAGGSMLLIKSSTLNVALFALFLEGLGCASIYPTYISWLSKWYGARAKQIGGMLFALASLGGSAGPLLVGVVSTQTSSLRTGLLVPVVSAAAMFCLVLSLRRQTPT